jgi:DNA-binding response OmpR family regulator
MDGKEIDVAILDVRLPAELGTQLAQHLVQKYGHIRIIFVTGYDDLERFNPRIQGASLLVKPFSFEALWARI